jgi:hypothetical protein
VYAFGGKWAAALPAVVLLGMVVPSTTVSASSLQLTVNTLTDPGGAGCTGGVCSLRQAIAASTGATAQISFAVGGTIQLSQSLGELHATGVGTSITIDCCNQPVVVDASQLGTRVLEIDAGVGMIVYQLTFSGGRDTTGMGGGILVNGSLDLSQATVTNNATTSSGSAVGGGVAVGSGGGLSLIQATISGNQATAPSQAQGGGIGAIGTGNVAIQGSSLSGNQATATAAVGTAAGGGVYDAAPLSIDNSTLSGNVVTASDARGGGLEAAGGGSLTTSTVAANHASTGGGLTVTGGVFTIAASTLSGNQASQGAGVDAAQTVHVAQSILNDAPPAECLVESGGTILSDGYDIDGGTSCGFAGTGDQQNTDAQLSPLQANGILPATEAIPQYGAASHGPATCGSNAQDERGVPRPQGATCDIGAYEYVYSHTTTSGWTFGAQLGTYSHDILVNASVSNQQLPPLYPLPTGPVQYLENGQVVGTAPLQPYGPDGVQATLRASTLAPGWHTLTESYGGDAHNQPSVSTPVASFASTRLLLSETPQSPNTYDPVRLLAQVQPAGISGNVCWTRPGNVVTCSPVDSGGNAYADIGDQPLGHQDVPAEFIPDSQNVAGSLATMPLDIGPPTPYRLVASDGGIFDFGGAYYGSTGSMRLNQPIVGMASTPDDGGYWLVASDGGIFSFGDAAFHGSTGAMRLNQPVVGMARTPDGRGYWLVARDGGIFSFGDAAFHGSTGAMRLNQPIVGMAATPGGGGYWLVAADGGIFSFGDAAFHGSTGAMRLNQPIVGMAATPDGGGYWLVARDGGVFTFGDAGFHGALAWPSSGPIVGIAPTADGDGYWLARADGTVLAFWGAIFQGQANQPPLNEPIVGISAG